MTLLSEEAGQWEANPPLVSGCRHLLSKWCTSQLICSSTFGFYLFINLYDNSVKKNTSTKWPSFDGRGAMASVGQRRPPWLGCVFVTYLTPSYLCFKCAPTPKPNKIQPLSNLLSPSILVVWGCLKYPSSMHA